MTELSAMCSFTMMRINALLDEELDDDTAEEVREHIESCDHCYSETDIWVTIRAALKHAYRKVPVPQSTMDKVTSQIHQLTQSAA